LTSQQIIDVVFFFRWLLLSDPQLHPRHSLISCIVWKYTYIKPCKWVLYSFWGCFKSNEISIVIVITFNVIVIDYIQVLLILKLGLKRFGRFKRWSQWFP